MVSYEIAMGFALVGVLICAGIAQPHARSCCAQGGDRGFLEWFWLPLLPLFVIYFISGVAETNRAPFDVAEGESEIVAGFHVEYSGAGFAVFFLAEYANMILVSFLTAIMFLGGWLSPVAGLDRRPVWPRRAPWWLVRPRWCSSCSALCGCARPSRATATTRSCAWAGRCSSRSRSSGSWSRRGSCSDRWIDERGLRTQA